MSFRTDKLVLLLDTGTSTQVRWTAAKQLADITLKTFRAAPPDESKDELKPSSSNPTDKVKGEDIKPDVTTEEEAKASVTVEGRIGEDDAWAEVLDTIARLLPLIKSRSSETRSAASNALGLLASSLPPYTTTNVSIPKDDITDQQSINVLSLLSSGETLLASAGREYVAKPMTGADKAKRRKAMMGSLGLGEVGWGDDVDQVIGEDEEIPSESKDKNGEASTVQKDQKEAATATAPTTPQDIFEGLSSRQITMLKRKKGDLVAEANKMRKLNAQASGAVTTPTPTSETPTPAGSPKGGQSEVITIDPGAKARAAAAASGGAVEPTLDAAGNPVAPTSRSTLTMSPGLSPWTVVLLEILPDLGDQAWQTRHGTSLALLELFRSPNVSLSLPPPFLLSIARQLLTLMVLDRFGDFVGDTVMAPVRETAGQALGVLLKYLPDEAVYEVHATLLDMVKQPWAKRGKQPDGQERKEGEKFRWEVRHAGLLGIKYEVAVRGDLLMGGLKPEDGMEDIKPTVRGMLHDVVDAAIMALRDVDDDVRTVAASALLPITDTLSTALAHDELCSVVDTLWDCLGEGGDDLGSSTGAVMDLLGAMISHSTVMTVMSEVDASGKSRQEKITRIYAFIRHPIATVRLAVARVLQTFTTAPLLSSAAWHSPTLFALLFQNLVLEERLEIRSVSYAALISALEIANQRGPDTLRDLIEDNLGDWYQIVMTPPGAKIEPSLLTRVAKSSSSHNVDKSMLEGDLSLVDVETVMETRLLGAKALATLRQCGVFEDTRLIKTYLASPSAHQIYMASSIITQWSQLVDETIPGARTQALGTTDPVAKELLIVLLGHVERPLPPTYSEMTALLKRVYSECQALLTAFASEGKVSKDRIPTLSSRVDPLGNASDSFTLATAQMTVTKHFDALSSLLSKSATKNVLPGLKDRRNKVMVSIGRYGVMKDRYDVQVMAGIGGALVALRVLPPKIGPVVKAIMDSIKKEENTVLQYCSANAIASLIHLCGSPLHVGRPNPSDKVVKNLLTFLCQDTSINPIFKPSDSVGEILSLKDDKPKKALKAGVEEEETEEQISMRVMRQGALKSFERLADMFGEELLDKVPKYWEGISQPLIKSFDGANIEKADEQLGADIPAGQDVIDALTTLRLTASNLDPKVQIRIMSLFPHIIAALQSSYSLIRVSAAKCIATLCLGMTEDGMKFVVDHVVPLIGDAKRTPSRQGAVEAVHHIIKTLDIKALPYVLFLIVPILGRMSDPDEPVRLLSTSTFASLVKMVPLEAGIPDPPGFSPDLLAKRDEERKFLMQLLDGSKAEQYQIPIKIKADLRQYQKDGVSWLAFLAKYQLHGILCDDMGLGKSLQSICIVGSKHHERAQRHKQTGSVDSAHLPSLFVCPPTLCGHWYHEILKFTDYLRPIQYVGPTAQRTLLRQQLVSPDVDIVITSYETVRADIDYLSKIDWLYCVLDEGHIIKNAKTKLSAAVKQIKAQHRLLLSGTPIQNNVLELWSLFDFLMPGFLGTERVFNDRFSKPILADRDGKASPKERELGLMGLATAALESLHKQVLPFLLRRLKEDVLSDLPPKIIQDYHCELSDIQKQLYDEYSRSQAATEAGEEVQSDTGAGPGGPPQHVFQSLQYLRKLCNHPALVLQSEEARTKQLLAKMGSKTDIHDLVHAPKLEALKQLLTDCGIGQTPSDNKIKDEMEMSQHRVLIFCQLRPMLDLIEKDLFAAHMPSVTYMRMDGSTDPSRRHAVVQTFNQDPRIDVLLLTTSVGGLGLNLTGADTVIFVDHDWNPMKDLQAMDRAHRLGQRKVVNVYRLITRGTLEEKIMGLQRFKLNIASSVITQQNSGLGSMNTGEVLDLFTVSAEGDPRKKKDAGGGGGGPVSASKVLEGLEDLQPEDEYADLSLSNFMSKV